MPAYSVEDGFTMAAGVPVKALFFVLCGLCTSLMWGGIFNLSTEGLGKYTEQASGIFMMMVVGGGVMPLIQDFLASAVGYMGLARSCDACIHPLLCSCRMQECES